MADQRDSELLARFWALHAAVIRRDGLEERMRAAQPPDEELVDRSLTAAQGVLEARSALYRHLIAGGWTPPDDVVKHLAYDEIVLAQRDGAVHG